MVCSASLTFFCISLFLYSSNFKPFLQLFNLQVGINPQGNQQDQQTAGRKHPGVIKPGNFAGTGVWATVGETDTTEVIITGGSTLTPTVMVPPNEEMHCSPLQILSMGLGREHLCITQEAKFGP